MSEPRLQLKLAWRSLWRNRRRTEITLASIALGLALAIFFGALAHGTYQRVIRDATRLLAGQLTVEHQRFKDAPEPKLAVDGVPALRQRLGALPGVRGTKPVVTAQVVAASGSGSVGVVLVGSEPTLERASLLVDKLVAGHALGPQDQRAVLVGAGLATRLHLEPGRKLVLTAADISGNLNSELFRVAGVFRTGSEELDGFFLQAPLAAAQRLLGLRADQASQVGLLLDETVNQTGPSRALDSVRAAAAPLLGPGLAIRSWEEELPALASWISLDLKMNRILRGMIIFLVLFTILNTILMSVLERGHEFAVLLALGTPRALLRTQVLFEVVLLAAIGCGLGAALGCGAAAYGELHGIDVGPLLRGRRVSTAGMVLDPVIHCDLTWDAVLGTTLLVFAATVAIGLYPMVRSARVELASSLRTHR